MGQEIERKFLLKSDAWRANATGTMYRQGYLNSVKERTVRIRTVGDRAFLTIKGITVGATRAEYEYPIPVADCNAMLDTLAEGVRWRISVHAPATCAAAIEVPVKNEYEPPGSGE